MARVMSLVLLWLCFSPSILAARVRTSRTSGSKPTARSGAPSEAERHAANASMASSLVRDPEEEKKYNEQMLSAIGDKTMLLDPMVTGGLFYGTSVTVIDIGPAGGAIAKALAMMVLDKAEDTLRANAANIHYVGVELNAEQVENMTKFLESPIYNDGKRNLVAGRTPASYFGSATMVQGNALALGDYLKADYGFSVVVESSVLHEIYSYAPEAHNPRIIMPEGLRFAVGIQDFEGTTRYNPQTVYTNYEQALLQLSKSGGVLSMRDGVLYSNPDEPITFQFKSDDFVNMFNLFRHDRKYSRAVEAQLKGREVKKGVRTVLTAGLIQEFVLKANWGLDGWANEIHEVYCYATIETHLIIIRDLAAKHKLNIRIPTHKLYTQEGYIEHTTDHVEILSGFEPKKFPPTNMMIQVVVGKK